MTQDTIQNRFTPSRFTAPKPQQVAKSKYFSATITCTGRTHRADITWKGNYNGAGQITALSEDNLAEALKKLDPAVRFLSKHANEGAAQISQDDILLERARNDSKVSDNIYASMCARLKKAPQKRPVFYDLNPQVGTDVMAFRKAHPELAYGGFEEFNEELILQLLHDEQQPLTLANFEKAFSELSAAGNLRSFDTGRVGGRIVQPYSLAKIVALRQQARISAIQPPANLSPVDLQAWQLIHADNPSLDVRSQAFRSAMSRQITEWAKFRALEADPSLEGSALRQSIDYIILGWAQQGNANVGPGQHPRMGLQDVL